jgi:hypothetical protein
MTAEERRDLERAVIMADNLLRALQGERESSAVSEHRADHNRPFASRLRYHREDME